MLRMVTYFEKYIDMNVTTKTRTQLAKEYKVDYSTFNTWLNDIDELKLNPKRRLLTPKQVKMIYEHLGIPD